MAVWDNWPSRMRLTASQVSKDYGRFLCMYIFITGLDLDMELEEGVTYKKAERHKLVKGFVLCASHMYSAHRHTSAALVI